MRQGAATYSYKSNLNIKFKSSIFSKEAADLISEEYARLRSVADVSGN